jgi:transketolase
MSGDNMRSRFARVVSELLDTDPRMAVVLADISADRFREAARRHPERVINVGIREQLLVNVAAGMALAGMRPVLHTFAPFLVERAFEQVKLGFVHQGVGGVLVSTGASYDVAAYGRTHQSPGDVALMTTLPGVRIHVPGHPGEAEALLRDAVRSDDVVYLRLGDATNAVPRVIQPGELLACRRGTEGAPTLVAVGPMLDPVLAASADMDATVLYAATVRPFDGKGLREHVTGDTIVLVEPYLEGTSAAAVTAALADRPHRLICIGVPNIEYRRYGSRDDHDRAHGLDAPGLRARFEALFAAPRA